MRFYKKDITMAMKICNNSFHKLNLFQPFYNRHIDFSCVCCEEVVRHILFSCICCEEVVYVLIFTIKLIICTIFIFVYPVTIEISWRGTIEINV